MLNPILFAAEFYVSPNGSGAGDGSLKQPWDLQTALHHPTNIAGGDTIWLRGGIYRRNDQPTQFFSNLFGDYFNPIMVRQFPGERATIDGNISQFTGGWVNYYGFEIMNTYSNRLTTESGPFPTNFTVINGKQTNNLCVKGFELRAPDIKLINLVIHDSIGGGIGANTQATNAETIGTIIFYNGWQGCDRGHGHGYYGQNHEFSYVYILNSLFFANYAIGIQATANEGSVDNIILNGNTLFSNGVLARKHQANILIGPFVGPANNPALLYNLVYDTQGSGSDVNIGYTGGANNAALYENYFQTTVHFSPSNQNLWLYGNTFLGGTRFLEQTNFPDNAYATNRPQTNFVRVQHNIYEPGRAHITVYNWEGMSNVIFDPSGFFSEGLEFEVRNAQDFFGAPVLSGTYSGGAMTLPMTNLLVAKPVGTNAPPSTAPEFNVFILRTRETSPSNPANTAPVLSPMVDQFTDANTPTELIPFTISDTEMPPEFLTISVHSSRPDLIPNPNIRFQGSGNNRSITIAPMPNQFGTSEITIALSDGFLTVSNIFSVTVSSNSSLHDTTGNSAVLSIQSDNTALLRMNGPTETEYDVQASTNLIHWRQIGTIMIDCTGSGFLRDKYSSNYPTRFYRFAAVTDQSH